MANLKSRTLERLKQMDSSPKRSLGQNFLINEHVVDRIVQSLDPESPKTIEIGPGLGALTDNFLHWPHFQVVELDRSFADFWRQQRVTVLEGDALKMDWAELCSEGAQLVSNLPYQISSSLVINMCCGPDSLGKMVFMFQKEVAQRITSVDSCKAYGLLSVMAQNFWKVKLVTDVGTRDFHPAPRVNSRVLSFERKPFEAHGLLEEQRKSFLMFVKAAFQQRRKYMLKNIKSYLNDESKDKLIAKLTEWGFDEKVRAENLSPQQFLQTFKLLVKL